MKRLLLSLVLFAGIVASAWAAPTAKAIYCAENTTLYFTYDEVTYNTSTAYEQLDGKTPTNIYSVAAAYGNARPPQWTTNHASECTTAKFVESVRDNGWKPTSFATIFYTMTALTSIVNGDYLDTSEVTSLRNTFSNCSLTNLDAFSTWDVSKVTDFTWTFAHNSTLTDLTGVQSWDTSSGQSFVGTFQNCTSLATAAGLENWNFSSLGLGVTRNQINQFFMDCINLTDISALTNWDLSTCKNTTNMFGDCTSLSDISPLSNWDMSSVICTAWMFYNCKNLKDVSPLSGWDFSSNTEIGRMFRNSGVTDLEPLKDWDVSKVIYFTEMFRGCSGITNLDALSDWDTGSAVWFASMFQSCENLTDISGIEGWNTEKGGCMVSMFRDCPSLTGKIDLSAWDLSSLDKTNAWPQGEAIEGMETYKYGIDAMFFNCTGITGITLGKGNAGKDSYSYKYAFYNCPKLRYIDFSGCSDDLGNITTVNRKTINNLFCTVPLTTVIYLPKENAKPESGDVTNVVYTDGTELKCDEYYSEDKVDIEFPHDFVTPKAIYTRNMSSEHGTVILPYEFKTNDNILAYTLNKELTTQMFFVETPTIPAHTPFAFKKRQEAGTIDASADVTLDTEGAEVSKIFGDTDFSMVSEDGSYSITVKATNTTSASEKTVSGDTGAPYVDGSAAITDEAANKWTTKGYYVNETVEDYSGTFYIAGDKFYKADGALTMYPHRVTFHGAWTKGDLADSTTGAKSINFAMADVVTAIEAAEAREAEKNEIYDMQGRQQTKLNRGMNIVRMSDGSVRKIMVK